MKKVYLIFCFSALSFLMSECLWAQTKTDTGVLLRQLEGLSLNRDTVTQSNIAYKKVIDSLKQKEVKELPLLLKESRSIDKPWQYRCAIMQIFSTNQSEGVVNGLLGNLKDTNPTVRACAARELGVHKDSAVIDSLIVSLKDKTAIVRANSAYALGHIGNQRAVGYLVKIFKDTDREASVNAVWAVGEIRDKSGVDPLISLTNSSDEVLQVNTVVALGKIGGEKAKDRLKEMRKTSNKLMSELIDSTLQKIK